MTSVTLFGPISEAVRTWAGLISIGFLSRGLMKATNLADIGRSFLGIGLAFLLRSPVLYSHHGPRWRTNPIRYPRPGPVCRLRTVRTGRAVRRREAHRQYGWDAKLTDLLAELGADCPKRGSVSTYDRCKEVYERRG